LIDRASSVEALIKRHFHYWKVLEAARQGAAVESVTGPDRWRPLRADATRFGIVGRVTLTVIAWIVPGFGLWNMALHPGTVFFVFAFAWVPALSGLALYISVNAWRKGD
jgi:hypothetical protein